MTASESVEIKLLTDSIQGTNKKLSWFIGFAATVLITLIGWILINSNKEAEFRGEVKSELVSIKNSIQDIKMGHQQDMFEMHEYIYNNNLRIQEINNHLIKMGGYNPTVRSSK